MPGAVVGTLIVRLNAVTSQFRREMTEAQAKLQKTARVAEDASQTIATALAIVGTGAIVAGGAAIKLAAQWEQTEIAFETMLKSGEKARAFLAELEHFVDKTPFEMPGIINSTRRLKAFGFEAEEIIPMMTAVGDAVAAIGGGDFEIFRITYALGQMRAKGQLAAEEMSRQLGQIIPAWEFLAESIGVSVEEAKKMVEQGMIPATVGIQAILQGMAREYGGAMERQNRTLIGQWSTLKDRVRTILRGIGAYFIDTLNILPLLRQLNKTFKGLATAIRGVENPAEAMRNILQQAFTPERRLMVVALAGVIAGLLVPALVAAAKKAWLAAVALAPYAIKGAILAVIIYNLYDALTRANSALDKAVAVILALGVVTYFAYASGLVRFIGGLVVSTKLMWAKIAAATTLKAKLIAVLALLGPKGWLVIAGAIGVTVAAISLLNRALEQTTVALAGAPGQQIQEGAENAAKGQEALKEAMEESAKAAARNIMAFDQVHTLQEEMGKQAPVLPEMPGFELTGIRGLSGAIADLMPQMDKLSVDIPSIWETIRDRAREIWNDLPNIIITAFSRAKTWVGEISKTMHTWLSERWAALRTTAAERWNSITTTIATAIENARVSISTRWNTIGTWLGERWAAIRVTASTRWGEITTTISTAIENARVSISTRWNTIGRALNDTWDAIRESARNKWDAVTSTIRNAINGISRIINSFIRAFNRIRITVPAVDIPLVGRRGGFTIGMPQIPEIPMLAKGGIVTRPTHAFIGEAGPEAVIPLRRGTPGIEAIADAVGNAVLVAMREALHAAHAYRGGDGSREIVLEIDGTRLGRVVVPSLRSEEHRTGMRLAVT